MTLNKPHISYCGDRLTPSMRKMEPRNPPLICTICSSLTHKLQCPVSTPKTHNHHTRYSSRLLFSRLTLPLPFPRRRQVTPHGRILTARLIILQLIPLHIPNYQSASVHKKIIEMLVTRGGGLPGLSEFILYFKCSNNFSLSLIRSCVVASNFFLCSGVIR